MRSDRVEIALAAGGPGDAEGLLELLAGRAFQEAGIDLARSGKLAAVHGYVLVNRRAIANCAIVPLASSGPMEKGVGLTICRRFKAARDELVPGGVSHLLRLRILRLNGTWGRYWAERFRSPLRPWPAAA